MLACKFDAFIRKYALELVRSISTVIILISTKLVFFTEAEVMVLCNEIFVRNLEYVGLLYILRSVGETKF